MFMSGCKSLRFFQFLSELKVKVIGSKYRHERWTLFTSPSNAGCIHVNCNSLLEHWFVEG